MDEELTVSEGRTAEDRRALLANTVADHVRRGYRVESQTDYQAIVVTGRRPNHLLHLILSLCTLGRVGAVRVAAGQRCSAARSAAS